jgi:hypothetical protein
LHTESPVQAMISETQIATPISQGSSVGASVGLGMVGDDEVGSDEGAGVGTGNVGVPVEGWGVG